MNPEDTIENLNTYLSRARAGIGSTDAGAIVMGNEAADLDSMVSAILYGQLASAYGAPGAPLAVPVINCPRGDFALRTEAVYLFAALDVDVDALLFIDEINLEPFYRSGRLSLTLVDHNTLSAAQAKYADAVGGIIDHHADGGLYPQSHPRTIEPVGSSATLVAEAVLRDRPALIDRVSATLLLGTILLDTVNLDPAAGRVTPKDRDIAARLGKVTDWDADDLFARLQSEKFNLSALGTGDLLRKDYKSWETPSGRYGMSTVLISTGEWIAKDPGLVSGLESFLQSRGLACLMAMMAYTDSNGGFRRELVVYAPDPALAAGLMTMLEASDLELERIRPAGLADPDRVMMFTQGNVSVSRKKLQPLLHRFFSRDPG